MTASALVACGPKWHEEALTDGVQGVIIENGPTLGYSLNSGVLILEVDGLPFKDLDKDGELDAYEDWRLSVDERAKDLASQLSEEEIAGLMLYSRHKDGNKFQRRPRDMSLERTADRVLKRRMWHLPRSPINKPPSSPKTTYVTC